MDYRFTAILIIMLSLLTIFAEPAYPKNEYLNEYGVRCGEVDFRIEDRNRESDYRGFSSSDNETNEQNFSITFRKYLGTDCKTSKENVQLKQQLELLKLCGRYQGLELPDHFEDVRKKPNKIECYIKFNVEDLSDLELQTKNQIRNHLYDKRICIQRMFR